MLIACLWLLITQQSEVPMRSSAFWFGAVVAVIGGILVAAKTVRELTAKNQRHSGGSSLILAGAAGLLASEMIDDRLLSRSLLWLVALLFLTYVLIFNALFWQKKL